MKSFACYCQKCRAANVPGEELCANCGTPLMLIVTPPATRHDDIWGAYSEEHLLERISLLEMRLMQVTDRLSRVLDIMLKQAQTVQREHLLVETLVDALEAAKVIEGGQVSENWKDRQKSEEKREAASERRGRARDEALENGNNTKLDLFTHLVKEGFRQIEAGDELQGLRTLERAVAKSPENHSLLTYIGEHYYRADKRAPARDYLERANRLAPKTAKSALLLGVILADEGEIERARELLEQVAEKFGFAANFPLGLIYAAEKRLTDALAAFKRARSSETPPEVFYLVGSAHAEVGNTKTALKYLRRAIEIDSNYADAWYALGSIHLREDDEPAAKEALQMALAAKDAGAQCHAVLKNPKKYKEVSDAGLLFARLPHVKKNLVAGSAPRLVKLLREEIEKILIVPETV